MDPFPLDIDDLIPHQGKMRLVDKIVSVDHKGAATVAVAGRKWPLFNGKTIDPLVMIELVAQTAGIKNGVDRQKTQGKDSDKKGWLVGIKQATFFIGDIHPGDRLETWAENSFVFENYRQISGVVTVKGKEAARITLQVVQADNQPDPEQN